MVLSEGSQHIYADTDGLIRDNISNKNRCMIELGNIRGLEKDEVVNYILIPQRIEEAEKKVTSSWGIKELPKEPDVEVLFKKHWIKGGKTQKGNIRCPKCENECSQEHYIYCPYCGTMMQLPSQALEKASKKKL